MLGNVFLFLFKSSNTWNQLSMSQSWNYSFVNFCMYLGLMADAWKALIWCSFVRGAAGAFIQWGTVADNTHFLSFVKIFIPRLLPLFDRQKMERERVREVCHSTQVLQPVIEPWTLQFCGLCALTITPPGRTQHDTFSLWHSPRIYYSGCRMT